MYAEQRDWPGYFAAVEGKPPRETLIAAADFLEERPAPNGARFAVDLGCGEGRDTAELLRRGWRVLAIDGQPLAIELLRKRVAASEVARLETRCQPFEDLTLPECDLVNASFSLPFCQPQHFDALWSKIRRAIRPGGCFAGQLFGDRDAWATLSDRTHHTRGQVERLIDGMKRLRFEEEERDGEDCHGRKKHWHAFHIVTQLP